MSVEITIHLSGTLCDLLSDGLMQVDPTDIVVLVISWHFNAASIGEFSRSEFVDGMDELSCDSTAKLKRKLPQLRAELHDPQKFKVHIVAEVPLS